MLGYINNKESSKWLTFGVLFGVGLAAAAVGAFFLVKYRKMQGANQN